MMILYTSEWTVNNSSLQSRLVIYTYLYISLLNITYTLLTIYVLYQKVQFIII